MADPIRRCSAWKSQHERPIYTLAADCPLCNASTEPSGPAAFRPDDPYGKYRRALKRSQHE